MEIIRSIAFLRPLASRCIQTSSVLNTREWRKLHGLPKNKTTYGPLIDLPDYTYLDGRPTPMGCHQKRRALKQKELMEKIVQLSSEVDFAKQRFADMQTAEKKKRDDYLANQLKPKGYRLLKKS